MNKSISITYRSLLIIFLCTAITLLLLFNVPKLVSFISDENDNQINAILGVLGNISGGLIGGIVAYIVAAYQVSNSMEQEKQKELQESYINLSLLLDEIEFNKRVIDTAANNSSEDITQKTEYLNKQLLTSEWNRISTTFASQLNIDDFKNICKIYRNINFIRTSPSTVNDTFINVNANLLEQLIQNIKVTLNGISQKIK
jgi:transcriptional regulator of heat shock response